MTIGRRAVRIVGTGMALPSAVVDSEAIDRRLGLEPGATFAACGVRRRHASVDETAAALAIRACDAALERAGLAWSDIDCLVAASATPDQALPFNAAMVLDALGERSARPVHVAAFDIGASCLSFVAALDTMSVLVDRGRYRHVLIVSADIATFALDWSTPEASAIFGDGAAAAVIRRSGCDESSALLAARIETFPEGASCCHIQAGGSRFHPARVQAGQGDFDAMTRFHMDGRRVFRIASRELPRLVAEVLAEAGSTMAAMRVVVPHQASRLALDHLSRRLAIEPERLMDIFAEHGNQVAASLPTALHRAIVDRRVERGDALLLIGSGAGVTIGGLVLTY